jgi:hypothetical protein
MESSAASLTGVSYSLLSGLHEEYLIVVVVPEIGRWKLLHNTQIQRYVLHGFLASLFFGQLLYTSCEFRCRFHCNPQDETGLQPATASASVEHEITLIS